MVLRATRGGESGGLHARDRVRDGERQCLSVPLSNNELPEVSNIPLSVYCD